MQRKASELVRTDRAHLTPAQAAQSVGLSRWSVMRAIKSGRLKALRDNRGVWRIAPDDLREWAAHTSHMVREGAGAQEAGGNLLVALAVMTARAEAAERARDVAEVERDHWRSMAETLASRPRRWWWR